MFGPSLQCHSVRQNRRRRSTFDTFVYSNKAATFTLVCVSLCPNMYCPMPIIRAHPKTLHHSSARISVVNIKGTGYRNSSWEYAFLKKEKIDSKEIDRFNYVFKMERSKWHIVRSPLSTTLAKEMTFLAIFVRSGLFTTIFAAILRFRSCVALIASVMSIQCVMPDGELVCVR